MKAELSITEIAAKLGVSERTALRRIADGKLLAKKLGPNRYLVSTEDIEELAPRAKLAELTEQITALEQEITNLRTRVESLERQRLDTPVSAPVQSETRVARRERQAAVAHAPPSDLPAGSITLAELATELGINRTTLVGHVRDKHLDHIAIPRANRPGEYLRYFTPEQQDAVKQWRATRTRKPPTLWDD